MIKKFLKSKAGNIIILSVILIPLIIILFSTYVAQSRRENTLYNEIYTSIDTFSQYANETYGGTIYISTDDGYKKVSYYSESARTNIANEFAEYFTYIDGYIYTTNGISWTQTVSFDIDEETDEMYLVISVTVYLPVLNTYSQAVSYWGRYVNGVAYDDGWYSTHTTTMATILENASEKGIDGYLTTSTIEVRSLCY